jgi:DNA-binding NtrC family response regulator
MTAPNVVCASCLDADEPALAALERQGYAVRRCTDPAALVECVMTCRADLAIVRLRGQATDGDQMAMLRLLRRVAPELPLVVIGEGDSIVAEREVRALHPKYLALAPADPQELVEAVRGALARGAKRTA